MANSSIQAAGRSSVAASKRRQIIVGTTGGFMDRGGLTSAAGLKSAKGGLRNSAEGDA